MNLNLKDRLAFDLDVTVGSAEKYITQLSNQVG